MVVSLASHLLRLVLAALDTAGPSRARLALRRLGLRLRRPVLFDPVGPPGRDAPPAPRGCRNPTGAGGGGQLDVPG